MSDTTIYQEIQAALQRGERIAVASVVKTIGAAPCGVGSKMLIRADGTTSGSFAGPKTDGKVVQEALQALREGRTYTTFAVLDDSAEDHEALRVFDNLFVLILLFIPGVDFFFGLAVRIEVQHLGLNDTF